jgi:trimeric autotransporter adhesin
MPSNSFDATARINVDLRGFSTAAGQVLKSGGQMEQTFHQLHNVLGKIAPVEKAAAAELTKSLKIYLQVANAAKAYAGAVKSMAENEEKGFSATQHMATALDGLRGNLAKIQGLSQREADRIGRTVDLYERMASVLKRVAEAQQAMALINQRAEQAEQRRILTQQQSLINEQRLASATDNAASARSRSTTAANAALASQERLTSSQNTALASAQRLTAAENAALTSAQRLSAAQTSSAAGVQRLTVAQNAAAASAARVAAAESNAANAAARAATAQERLAAAQRRAGESFSQGAGSAFALRSALGEIESSGQSLVRTLLSVSTAVVGVAISHEASFAQVRRVLLLADDDAAKLAAQFQKIAVEFPISREDVDRVGQLAGQLGITKNEMDTFVRTIAQFSITTGVSSEQTTLFIGRIKQLQNVPVDQVNNLASAILHLGTISAATEEQILKVEDSISTVSNVFGLSVQATTALSAAFATLNIKPELSRGTLTRVFGQLEKAITGAGDGLKTLATLMNLTTDEVLKLRTSDPDTFLLKFVQGLATANAGGHSFRETLASLGITAVRDIDSFSRLGNNVNLLSNFMDESNKAWVENNELQNQSAMIFNTTQARLGNLKDAFSSLLAVIGTPLAGALGEVARMVTNVIERLVEFDKVFLGGGVLSGIAAGAVALGVLSAAFLAYKVVLAKVIQGMVAFREVQAGLGASTLSLRGAVQTWASTSTSATQAVSRQTAAMAAQSTGMTRGVQAAQAMTTAQRASALMNQELAAATVASVAAQRTATTSAAAAATSTNAFGIAVGNVARAETTAVATTQAYTTVMAEATAVQRAQATTALTSSASIQTLSGALTTEAAAATVAGTASAGASVGMRALLAATGPIGIALTLAGLAMTAFAFSADPVEDKAKGVADAAWNATSGLDGLKEALRKDALEFANSGTALQTWSIAASDVNPEVTKLRDNAQSLADQLSLSAVQLYGSEAAMRNQAEGTGTAADAARKLSRDLDIARKSVETQKLAVEGNTVAFGLNTAAKFQSAFTEALLRTEVVKSQGAMERFKDTGIDLALVMEKIGKGNTDEAMRLLGNGLDRAQLKFKELDRAATEAEDTLAGMRTSQAGSHSVSQTTIDDQEKIAKALRGQANDASGAVTSFEALRKTLSDGKGNIDETARAQSLLGTTSEGVAAAAREVADALAEENEQAAETAANIEALVGAFDAIGSPATAWKNAMETAAEAADETAKKTTKVAVSVKDLMKAMEEAVAAQRDYATNLVNVMARVPSDVAAELAKMGPESANLIKLLTEMSKPELDKYVSEFRATGLGARTALANVLTEAAPILASMGGATGTAISKALGDAMNKAVGSGGNVEVAVRGVGDAIKTLGLLRADPKVNLDKAPFEKGLAEVIAFAYEASTGHKLDAAGIAKLAAGDYKSVLGELEARAKAADVNVNGKADINAQQWNAKVEEMQRRAREGTLGNTYGVTGKASLNTDAYYGALGGMSNTAQSWSQRGYFSPYGSASVNTDSFYNSLNAMKTNSASTGQTVKANLTQSAYITYFFKAGNSPPDARSLFVADGGWIKGPGGPRDDKVPAMLSNGEFVVNAAAANKYASLLETINSSGGRGGSSYSSVATADPDQAWASLRSAPTPRSMVGSVPTGGMPGGGTGGGGGGPRTVITVHNTYPREEPTSTTINRSLAYAATLSGV